MLATEPRRDVCPCQSRRRLQLLLGSAQLCIQEPEERSRKVDHEERFIVIEQFLIRMREARPITQRAHCIENRSRRSNHPPYVVASRTEISQCGMLVEQ